MLVKILESIELDGKIQLNYAIFVCYKLHFSFFLPQLESIGIMASLLCKILDGACKCAKLHLQYFYSCRTHLFMAYSFWHKKNYLHLETY